MCSQRIIMPLPYKNFSTFDIPTWYFDDTACLETIYDEDFGAFYRDELDEFYTAAIDIKTSCIYIKEFDNIHFEDISRKTATQFKYVLNAFALNTPITVPFALLVESDTKAHIQKVLDLEPSINLHFLRKQEFKIKTDADSATVSDFYKIVRKCCDKNPPLLFTLERFNSSLTRGNLHDKIVDITISLETLISGKDELRFKFSLFNSFISTSSPDERWRANELFSNLYDARSSIVHGDTSSKSRKKLIDNIEQNWEEIIKLARASLNYHVFFLDQKPRDDWDTHLKELVFAKEGRIVE